MRTLVAEDDRIQQRIFQKILKRYGSFTIKSNGVDAVNQFLRAWDAGDPYDLIILDIIMPKLDGIQTLKKIRMLEDDMKVDSKKRASIITITASSDPEIFQKVMEERSSIHLFKPIDIKLLMRLLHEAKDNNLKDMSYAQNEIDYFQNRGW